MNDNERESFEQFRKSFSYGSRTDLNYKFLAGLSDADASEFLRRLLELLVDAFDSGDYASVLDHVYQSQVEAYASGEGRFQYDDVPWAPLRKPLAQARLALISAGGVFVEGEDPLGEPGPSQAEVAKQINEFMRGVPELTSIPLGTPGAKLRVRHPGYDVRAANRDPNTVFPIDRLRELAADGAIGELYREAYSFVGATSQLRLRNDEAPKWAARLRAQEIDAVLLVAT